MTLLSILHILLSIIHTAMKKHRIRITAVRRDPPDLGLLAEALIALVRHQEQQGLERQNPKPPIKPGRGRPNA